MQDALLHGHVDGDRSDDMVGGEAGLVTRGLRGGEGGVVAHKLWGLGVLVRCHGGVAVVRVSSGRAPVACTYAVR